jgi:ABC-type branched-subunit amino acid transport system ATPase component
MGGIGSVAGAVLAGVLLAPAGLGSHALEEWFDTAGYESVIGGIGLIVVAAKYPDGLAGAFVRLMPRRRHEVLESAGDTVTTPGMQFVGSTSRAEPRRNEPPAMATDSISVRYGGVDAVRSVSIKVFEGEVVGLIGPNGAGKTSFIDAISGFVPHDGDVVLGEHSVTDLKPHERARAGLIRTFQSLELFDDLTVSENVRAGLEAGLHRTRPNMNRRDFGRADPAPVGTHPGGDGIVTVATALDHLGLAEFGARRADELSQGQRANLALARALAGRPAVLILDEPAAGLSAAETALLASRLRQVRDGGSAILLVDHDVGFVMDVCDRIYVLDVGEVIAEGDPASVQADPLVRLAYLGEDTAADDDDLAVTP